MNTVATEMIKYYAGDKKRINHFIKVHGYAKAIGTAEELDERTMLILETAAYVHDIGIKISEEKYNSSAGKYQEIEGPPIAEEMLTKLRYNKDVIERVSYLVAHHHTYSNIDPAYTYGVSGIAIWSLGQEDMRLWDSMPDQI